MKAKGMFKYIAVFSALLLLGGCGLLPCGDIEVEKDLTQVTSRKTSVAFMDSVKQEALSDKKWEDVVYWVKSNSVAYGSGIHGVTFELDLLACSSATVCEKGLSGTEVLSSLQVDLYGCDSYDCKNVQNIVLHDSSYAYIRTFGKDEFEIADGDEFQYDTFGDDCVVYKLLNFNLRIDAEDVKIDWDVKNGYMTCDKVNRCSESGGGSPGLPGLD